MLRISWNTQTFAAGETGDLETRSYEHTLVFDAVTAETHEGTSVLTEHAVEEGAPLSDHKRVNPDRLTVEAIVTNTPLDAPPPSGYGNTSVQASVGEGNVVVFSATFDRIADVLFTLRRLRTEATPVTVSTAHHTYDNVQVVNVTNPREPGDGDAIRVNIDLQQVRVAQSRTVDTPQPREPRGAQTRDRGGQETSDETRRVSTLATMRDEYDRRRAAGESRTDAALGAAQAAFGGAS